MFDLYSISITQESFHVFGRRLLAKIHAKLGWEKIRDESHTDGLLRSLVINRLAGFDG